MPKVPYTEEKREYFRQRYIANRERMLAKHAAYRASHKAEEIARRKAYYAKHRAERRAVGTAYDASHAAEKRAYREAHREQHAVKRAEWKSRQTPEILRLHRQVRNANTQAKRLGVSGRIRFRDVRYLPDSCVYCGSTENLTVDHATPTTRGGENHWSNLTTACFDCNRRKSDRTVQEFINAAA